MPSREPPSHGRTASQDVTPGGYGTGAQDIIHGSQVVAVGTALATSSLPIGAQQGPVMVCCLSVYSIFKPHKMVKQFRFISKKPTKLDIKSY